MGKAIVYLQETESSNDVERLWRQEYKGSMFFAHGTTTARGVAILISQSFQAKTCTLDVDDKGRYLLLNVTIGERNYLLFNVYAPTKDHLTDQIAFAEEISVLLSKYEDKEISLAGDFNTVLNPKLDKDGGKIENISPNANNLITIIDTYCLIDIWRICNPDKKHFTHRQNTRQGLVHSRLDYFLVSTTLTTTL